MAAIDKVKQARGLSPSAPASPPPPSPNELRTEIGQLRTEIGQLRTELRSLHPQMTAWPEAISARLAALFRTEQQQAEERGAKEVGLWRQERATVSGWMNRTYEQLQGSAAGLNNLLNRLLEREQERVWGLSRERWKGLGWGVLVSAAGALIYLQVGPLRTVTTALMKAQADLSAYRQLWDTATTAEQKKIRQRLANKTAAK